MVVSFPLDGARSDSASVNGGAGLGLSIARCVAEAHGGTIELVRADPTGTTFAIRLPLEQSSQ